MPASKLELDGASKEAGAQGINTRRYLALIHPLCSISIVSAIKCYRRCQNPRHHDVSATQTLFIQLHHCGYGWPGWPLQGTWSPSIWSKKSLRDNFYLEVFPQVPFTLTWPLNFTLDTGIWGNPVCSTGSAYCFDTCSLFTLSFKTQVLSKFFNTHFWMIVYCMFEFYITSPKYGWVKQALSHNNQVFLHQLLIQSQAFPTL